MIARMGSKNGTGRTEEIEQDHQDRTAKDRAAMTSHDSEIQEQLQQDSQKKSARTGQRTKTGLPGWDCLDGTEWTGLPGLDCRDGTAWTYLEYLRYSPILAL
jgi:hypothetical protein